MTPGEVFGDIRRLIAVLTTHNLVLDSNTVFEQSLPNREMLISVTNNIALSEVFDAFGTSRNTCGTWRDVSLQLCYLTEVCFRSPTGSSVSRSNITVFAFT